MLFSAIYCAPVDKVVEEVETVEVTSHADEEHVQDAGKKIVPTKPSKVVEILESGLEHQTDGSYSFHYRGADGSFREETAVVRNPGTENEYLEISGAYSFFDADGKEVVVQYKADDKGFVPVGNNIPDAISIAARENSQLPPVNEDNDNEDSEGENIPKKKERTTN